jgi:hypothetical protein
MDITVLIESLKQDKKELEEKVNNLFYANCDLQGYATAKKNELAELKRYVKKLEEKNKVLEEQVEQLCMEKDMYVNGAIKSENETLKEELNLMYFENSALSSSINELEEKLKLYKK